MTGMAEAMAKRGIEVLVLADGKTHEADHKQKYKIKRFTGWKPLRRLAKARYVEKICNSENVKAIYADSWKSIEYLKKYRKKILVLAHGTEIPKQYWTIMLDLMRFKKNRIINSYKDVYKILANSSYTKDLMQASLKIDTNLIKIIHPGIDVYDDFITEDDKKNVADIIGKNSPIITTLARVEERKGHMFILNALPEIKEKNPGFAAAIEADSGANYGTPLDMVAPETMGSLVNDAAGAFAANTGSTSGATLRKRQLANVRNIAAAGPGPASPGGGSAGIQSDLEGLQTKLADLKSQIDNLANTV